MKTPVFTGAATAIVTPFRDGKIDFDKFGQLIDMQIEAGIAAITVCGTTGESSTQTLEEHVATVDYCVRRVNGRAKVIAGSGSNDTEAALYLSKSAEDSGADALLLVTPYYNKATQKGLIAHYTYIADRVSRPIILYNVPSRTGCGIQAKTYKALSEHPLINGVKEASGNFTLMADTLALCGDALNMWSGNDDNTVPMMSLGAKGLISVTANVIPADVVAMCAAALEGDFRKAAELQLRMQALNSALFIEVNPIPVKAAMNLIGLDVGFTRLPLCDMEEANLQKLREVMLAYGLAVQ